MLEEQYRSSASNGCRIDSQRVACPSQRRLRVACLSPGAPGRGHVCATAVSAVRVPRRRGVALAGVIGVVNVVGVAALFGLATVGGGDQNKHGPRRDEGVNTVAQAPRPVAVFDATKRCKLCESRFRF